MPANVAVAALYSGGTWLVTVVIFTVFTWAVLFYLLARRRSRLLHLREMTEVRQAKEAATPFDELEDMNERIGRHLGAVAVDRETARDIDLPLLSVLVRLLQAADAIFAVQSLTRIAPWVPTRRSGSLRRISAVSQFLVVTPSGAGDLFGMLLMYLKTLFLMDALLYRTLLRLVERHRELLRSAYLLVGQVDALQALAAYRASFTRVCLPRVDSNATGMSAEGLYKAPNRNYNPPMGAEKGSSKTARHSAGPHAGREDLATAGEIAGRLRARLGSEIDRIVLFGSRAKGIPKPNSDFDLFVVVPSRDQRVIDEIYDETTEYELTHGIDVSLKVYSRDALRRHQELGTPFIKSVQATGVEL